MNCLKILDDFFSKVNESKVEAGDTGNFSVSIVFQRENVILINYHLFQNYFEQYWLV